MKIYPGELRFCVDCIHRTIVNGCEDDKIRCERLGIRLKHASEANQCLLSDIFEETAMAKKARKDFYVGDFAHIVLE